MCYRATDEMDVQSPIGLPNVVDIDGQAGDVLVGTVVARVLMDTTDDVIALRTSGVARHGHGAQPRDDQGRAWGRPDRPSR
jgi:hypothetical protein